MLAGDRLPTEMGRHLGISVVDDTEKGWKYASYTPTVLAQVAEILLRRA